MTNYSLPFADQIVKLFKPPFFKFLEFTSNFEYDLVSRYIQLMARTLINNKKLQTSFCQLSHTPWLNELKTFREALNLSLCSHQNRQNINFGNMKGSKFNFDL